MVGRAGLRLPTFVLVLMIATSLPTPRAVAQEEEDEFAGASQRPILILVDTSSSMGDSDGAGKIRIEGAKEALTLLVERLPPSSSLGVWTYPGSGCNAGSLKTTGYERTALIDINSVTNVLEPNGDTPTAVALRAAAEDLRDAGGSTIVLISDGESNCGGGACAAAEQLANEGFEIRFDTVGFQISAEGRDELECIAAATGGTYRDVEDSEELIEALKDATVPSLAVNIDEPVEVTADLGPGFPRSTWSVSATVTADGGVNANDVSIAVRFTGDRRPVLFDASRLVSGLAAGESHTVTWQFSVPVDCGYDIPLEVVARATGAVAATDVDTIRVPGGDTLACLILADTTALTIMGDSYSSGEGAPPYDAGTDVPYNEETGEINQCRRGQTYGRASSRDQFTLIACRGAIIHDLLVAHSDYTAVGEPGERLSAQLEQLIDLVDEADGRQVVMLSISGNDIWFAKIAEAGIRYAKPKEGSGETDKFQQWVEFAGEAITNVENPLLRSLRIIESTVNHDRDAPVQFVLIPYVQAIPGEEFPEQANDCPIGSNLFNWEIQQNEAIAFEGLRTNLNATVRSVATQLRLDGRPVQFASSVSSKFADNTVCDDDPWSHSIKLSGLSADLSSLHPNNDGYVAIWEAILNDAEHMSVLERSNDVRELIAHDGALCTSAEAGAARTIEISDGGSEDVVAGECVWVVGKNDFVDPTTEDVTGFPSTSLEEFEEWAFADIYLASSPQLVGRADLDETGTFRTLIWVPSDVDAGEHQLSFSVVTPGGATAGSSITLNVIDRGQEPYRIAAWFFAGLASVGVGLVLIGRSRRSPIEPQPT